MQETITQTHDSSTIEKMKQTYKSSLSKTPPHASFQAKLPGVVITAYLSGKVVFQGNQAGIEASNWGGSESCGSNQTKSKQVTNSLPKGFENWAVIGSDEVGNGSYLGPVVVCATYVEKQHIPLLKELGVKDSKMLKDSDIRRIAKEIIHVIPFKKLTVTPEKYNEIQPNYNVNRMKVALHNQAIYLLLQQISPTKPKGILIDQFTPEANYRKYLKQEKNAVTSPLYFTTKGEQYHLSVAAASIICRAEFLDELERASIELGITIPSGAGKASDLAAAKILKKGGLPLLNKYAKLHFANTKKAQAMLNR